MEGVAEKAVTKGTASFTCPQRGVSATAFLLADRSGNRLQLARLALTPTSLLSLIRPMDESHGRDTVDDCARAPLPAAMQSRGESVGPPFSSIRPMDETPCLPGKGVWRGAACPLSSSASHGDLAQQRFCGFGFDEGVSRRSTGRATGQLPAETATCPLCAVPTRSCPEPKSNSDLGSKGACRLCLSSGIKPSACGNTKASGSRGPLSEPKSDQRHEPSSRRVSPEMRKTVHSSMGTAPSER